jgi:hypothetical protein
MKCLLRQVGKRQRGETPQHLERMRSNTNLLPPASSPLPLPLLGTRVMPPCAQPGSRATTDFVPHRISFSEEQLQIFKPPSPRERSNAPNFAAAARREPTPQSLREGDGRAVSARDRWRTEIRECVCLAQSRSEGARVQLTRVASSLSLDLRHRM